MAQTKITTAPWVYFILLTCAMLSGSGMFALGYDKLGWEFWGLVILLVLFLISLLSAMLTKIENQTDVIKLVSNFRYKEIQKVNIKRVLWTKGSGSFLILNDRSYLRLPITGRNEQSVTNCVRSWLDKP
jgi:hypothetical protein